jgi:hypothetical protein
MRNPISSVILGLDPGIHLFVTPRDSPHGLAGSIRDPENPRWIPRSSRGMTDWKVTPHA